MKPPPDSPPAAVDRFLASLRLRNASPNTIRGYRTDLLAFSGYFAARGAGPADFANFTRLNIREYMADGFARGHSQATAARRLASVRAFFDFLVREEGLAANPARLVATPKIPKKLPAVLSTEDANRLIDGIVYREGRDRFPNKIVRDRLIFELLYGAGLRANELAELNTGDIDRRDRWLRVRGKAARSGKSLTARTRPRRWNVTCGSASGCRRRGKPPRCCCTSGAARGGGSRCGRSAASSRNTRWRSTATRRCTRTPCGTPLRRTC